MRTIDGCLNSSFSTPLPLPPRMREEYYCNHWIRSAKSIKKEKQAIVEHYKAYVVDNLDDFVLETKTYHDTKISYDYVAIRPYGIKPYLIHSTQSGQVISWHDHDVYLNNTVLDVIAKRDSKTGQLKYYADETKLYDYNKLQKLADSDNVKNKKLAFFFHDELNRLLGRKHGRIQNMSGLFA